MYISIGQRYINVLGKETIFFIFIILKSKKHYGIKNLGKHIAI